MRKFFLICLLISINFLPHSILAQSPQPTATPESDKNNDEINISTNLIQLDVVVTDKKNRPVSNLKLDDFEIYQNGKKQDISNFSFISSKRQKKSNTSSNDSLGLQDNKNGTNLKEKISIPKNDNVGNSNSIRRTMVIVVDDIGLSFRSVKNVKDSIKKFIKEQIRSGDLVSVVTTSGASVLPSFTSDKKQLLAIVKKLKWAPNSRGGVDYYEPLKPTLLEEVGENNPAMKAQIAEEKATLQDVDLARKNSSVIGTLGSLEYIVRGMQNLPGRKSLVFFSEGFSLSDRSSRNSSNADKDSTGIKSLPSATNQFGSGTTGAMQSLVKTANQTAVVIYPIDPRGLQNVGMAFADEDIRKAFGSDFKPGQTDDARTSRDSYFRQTQDGLRVLASETGGFATLNQNNLNKGLKRIIDEQSYYLLAFVTNLETIDSSTDVYEKIVIKVNNPNLQVRYRSTFYSPDSIKKGSSLSEVPRERVGQALAYPFKANEIELNLYSITGNYEQGNFVRFLVNISAKDLKFKKHSKGNRKANFDILAITLDSKGKPINQFAKNFSFTINDATYKEILKKGFVYDLPVILKKSGVYHFRVAVYDSETGRVGAAAKFIETPKFEKKKLWVSNLILQGSSIKTDKTNQRDNDKGMFTDTTLRQFTVPFTLNYGAVIYNANMERNASPDLAIRTRLIKDGVIISETPYDAVSLTKQKDFKRIEVFGNINLKKNLKAGNYIFQIIIMDKNAKKKSQIATQVIDFELMRK